MDCLRFDNVSFSYGEGAAVLDHLGFTARAGEFICLLGCNGSGKSTLARHCNALLLPDEGTVSVFGDITSQKDRRFSIRKNVGMVFQDPDDQIVASLVEDDVAFGPSNLGITGEELRGRVTCALERVGLGGFERRNVSELSGGEKQLVAIAGALAMEPRALVLDETTSMLDPSARRRLLALCRTLSKQGLTVVLITHSLDEAAYADRVIALHGGTIALDGPPDDVLAHKAALEAIGLEDPFFLKEGSAKPQSRPTGKPLIELQNVSFSYNAELPPVLERLSLRIHEGELVGIAGSNGAGKSTLVQLMSGLLAPSSGNVKVAGHDLSDKSYAKQVWRTIGMAFQQPEHQLFGQTVFEDVAFGPRNLNLSKQEIENRVAEALALVGLDAHELRDRSPFTLSGGEQRRVALAGALALQPKALVLDEPTAGLDPRMRNDFLKLIMRLNRDQGITAVLVSHDVDYLDHLCDRVLTLS